MRSGILFAVAPLVLFAGLTLGGWCAAQESARDSQVPSAAPSAAQAEVEGVEAAIRASAKRFVDAFGQGDAAAVAALWAPDGVYIDEAGQRFVGRDAIEQEYATFFNQNPGRRLAVEIDSVRALNNDTVIEEGRAAIEPQPAGTPRAMSRYTAVHTRQDGQWLLADVRETLEVAPPAHGRLEDLDWLSGPWKAAGEKAQIDVNYRWIANRKFLSRVFTSQADGATASGLEIIGVDPVTGQITSWTYTSDGGHAVGYWYPHENETGETGWIVAYEGLMGDGTPMSATNTLIRQADDTVEWKSENRLVGDRRLAETKPILLRRAADGAEAR